MEGPIFLPCPSCGNRIARQLVIPLSDLLDEAQIPSDVFYKYSQLYIVICAYGNNGHNGCGLSGPSARSEEEAIQLWNTRPPSDKNVRSIENAPNY